MADINRLKEEETKLKEQLKELEKPTYKMRNGDFVITDLGIVYVWIKEGNTKWAMVTNSGSDEFQTPPNEGYFYSDQQNIKGNIFYLIEEKYHV
jgi:uncharacterized protein YigE (DUF2233 family)